jgi:chloramphenicol O-acetyltransferase type A
MRCQNAAMDAPTPVDLETWPRRRHFEHYLRTVPCTYSLTAEIDVTAFVAAARATRARAYIAQVWAIATVVNRHEEFRMTLTESGTPAIWTHLDPSFAVFRAERETFMSLSAPYDPEFAVFAASAAKVIAEHADSEDLFPQGGGPPNTFDISSIPWTDFTGFTLHIRDGWSHLAPIFTLGRYVERDGRVLLPLSVQVHHAVADGFHTARLVNDLRGVFADASWLG